MKEFLKSLADKLGDKNGKFTSQDVLLIITSVFSIWGAMK